MNGTHTAAALLLALCTATALLPPAVAHETPPPYPQFEPNDDFSTATEIEPRTLHGLQPIKFTSGPYGPAVGATEMGWMHQRRDVDYYAVDLERGDALPVTLYHYGSDGNLRYTLYDPSKTEITTVDPDGNWQRTGSALTRSDRAIQRGEHTITAQCDGTYYVKVANDGTERAPYRLEVDDRFEHNDDLASAPTITEGRHEHLAVTTYDTDAYAIQVRKGERIDATIRLTTQAHWGVSPAVRPVRVQDPVTPEEWAPYNHTRWEDPSFKFRASPGVHRAAGDLRVRAVNQVKNDELHRDKVSVDVTESGTIYLVLRPSTWWTSAIDGAAKWTANAARYNVTVTRSGTPAGGSESGPSPDERSADSSDDDEVSVREALSRVEAEADGSNAGFAASQLAGERVRLRVDGEETYSFDVSENLEIENFGGCGDEHATVEIEIDGETLRRIHDSDSPGRELRAAFGRRDLRVNGLGPVNTVKWGVVNAASGVADRLSL